MIEGYIANVLGQLLSRNGLFPSLLGVAIFASILLIAYYTKNKVDVMKIAETNKEAARAHEAQGRERERQAVIMDMQAARGQMSEFLATQAKILSEISLKSGEQVEVLRSMKESMDGHEFKESDRAGKLFDKLDEIRLDIARDNRIQ